MQAHILKLQESQPKKLKKCKAKKCHKKFFAKNSIDGQYCADCSFEKYFETQQTRIDHFL